MKKYYLRSALKMNFITKVFILAFLILAGLYLVNKFFDTYRLQTPIEIRLRFPIQRRVLPKTTPTPRVNTIKHDILPSPTPTEKPKASIQSFPKYLTSNGEKNREYALSYLSKYYSGDELTAADNILKKEAGYRTDAVNSSSGACGIVQANPCSKLNCPLNDSGLDCQLNWFIGYLNRRYGSPLAAWNTHINLGYY
jgi:hypothetical protein